MEVEERINAIANSFADVQAYPTDITGIDYRIEDVPDTMVKVVDQRMYGSVLSYHHVNVDANEADNGNCVYQYLIKEYQPKKKSICLETLLEIFKEKDECNGVTTRQLESFCQKYGIPLYALDVELKLRHKYVPDKKSHKFRSLIYVIANHHMYPMVSDTERRSFLAKESAKSSDTCFQSNSHSRVFDNGKDIALNPEWQDIHGMTNTNVIFTSGQSLLSLLVYIFESEGVIYETKGYGGNILSLQYKNGTEIHINHDYDNSRKDCKALQIVFKNQNSIHLVREAFETYRQDDRIHSTFNSQVKEIFFCYNKAVFNHVFYEPEADADLIARDIQKCHTACLTTVNDYDWCCFTIFDEVKDFSGKLQNGFYYVETENFFPLRGNGWYSRGILETLQYRRSRILSSTSSFRRIRSRRITLILSWTEYTTNAKTPKRCSTASLDA
jgi:hypothetical protein